MENGSPLASQNDNSNNSFQNKTLISIFIILIVTGFGYFVLKNSSRNQFTTPEGNISQNIEPEYEVKDGWKFYRNKVLGIEFTYPQSWGEPYTYPEHLTDLNAFVNKEDHRQQNGKQIFISFKDVRDGPKITLFNNKTHGLEEIYNPGGVYGYLDEVSKLRDTKNICDYFFANYYSSYFGDYKEIYNSCENGLKKNIIEKTEDFTSSTGFKENPGILYTYKLNYFTYSKAGNIYLPDAIAKFSPNLAPQKKFQVTAEDFIRNEEYRWHKNINDVDFIEFATSIKPITTYTNHKSKVEILPSDPNAITAIKSYYNSLARSDYNQALSYIINTSQTKEEYISKQNNIYDQTIKEINNIGENKYEVFLDVQIHNEAVETYRVVFEVINDKLKQTVEEKLNGEMSKFNNMRAYATERDRKTILVLEVDGREKIVDAEEYGDDYHGEEYIKFYSPYFSSSGRYLIYHTAYWEGGTSSIYDILNNKLLNGITEGDFNEEESLYFACRFDDSGYTSTEAKIYKVPQFSVKTDLLKLHPELEKYWEYKCSIDEKSNTIIFEFSGNYGKDYNPEAKEIYKFNGTTGEIIP